MTITVDGVVQAKRTDHQYETVVAAPWLQLSNQEIADLEELLEPFGSFDGFYQDPQAPTDGPYVHIAVGRDGVTDDVSIYPANYDAVPLELKDLKDQLGTLFTKAMQE